MLPRPPREKAGKNAKETILREKQDSKKIGRRDKTVKEEEEQKMATKDKIRRHEEE